MASIPYKVAGIMGWPVGQSRSPLIHNYWIEKYGLDGDYIRLPVQPDAPNGLRDAIAGMRAMGFAGCNLTMPHKTAALEFVDHLDPMAKRMGAVNTLVLGADGSVSGFNNDGFGYVESLREVGYTDFAKGPITVLGAGGAARAVMLALADAGATEIRLANRTDANALATAQKFADEFGVPVRAVPWQHRAAALDGCALLINSTNQGMYGQPALDIALDALPRTALVSDVIYVPLETPLLAAAKARGHQTVNGLGMLLNQARPAFHAWFGVMPEMTDELRVKILATFN
ncbi:MAG: shikimate dehydrogenase [Cytophagales bacterium]|nr:shikimate dehydrogenase [Cytophagales bacterium]